MSQVAENEDQVAGLVDQFQTMQPWTSKFPLMSLPWEIRLQIIDLVTEPIYQVFLRSRETPVPMEGKLHRAGDRRLRSETLLVILEKSKLEIHSGWANDALFDWLGRIDFTLLQGDTSYATGFDAVKRLEFPYFSRFPHDYLDDDAPNNDLELAKLCRNLQELNLTLADDAIHNPAEPGEKAQRKGVEQLRREYRLDTLFELPSLQRLTLLYISTRFSRKVDHENSRSPPMLSDLKAWLREGFGERDVEVKCEGPGCYERLTEGSEGSGWTDGEWTEWLS